MALEDYKVDMMRCEKDSVCKFVPLMMHNSQKYSEICPSIKRFNFHTFSGSGRLFHALGFLRGRHDYSEEMVNMVYNCQMCGGCDVTCKAVRDLEVLETLIEMRVRCVEDGQIPDNVMEVIDGLKKENNMMMEKKADRGKWADKLKVKDLAKEKAEVCFHAGCRFSYDETLWPTLRGAVEILQKAKVDFGIFGASENCCAGRAYEMGFQGELVSFMQSNLDAWKNSGAKIIVTPCSDCYATFKAWYSRFGKTVEVYHITEYLQKLIEEGKLKFKKEVPINVTYHDPCHLGRLSEPYQYSAPGKPYIMDEQPLAKVKGICCVYEETKPWRRGENGIYDAPREILKAIPGVKLTEMERIRSWAFCCGAGGGVMQSNPDYAQHTARHRIEEALDTGADALVTACGWCERNFRDAIKSNGHSIEVYDILDLVLKAI
jgi:Fe-S oxidoreductase